MGEDGEEVAVGAEPGDETRPTPAGKPEKRELRGGTGSGTGKLIDMPEQSKG
jgi:hypothetical protein